MNQADTIKNTLDSLKFEINNGTFIPDYHNLINENSKIGAFRQIYVEQIIRNWLKRNTNFKDIRELKSHFSANFDKSETFRILIDFLNSKK